jgi:hypothetical protein
MDDDDDGELMVRIVHAMLSFQIKYGLTSGDTIADGESSFACAGDTRISMI